MHERSLAEDILRQIERMLTAHGAVRPVGLTLSVGEFAGVDARLLADATTDVLAEAGFDGVAIEVRSVPLQADCRSCGEVFAVERFQFECPRCRGRDVEVERGEGLVLDSVTLEAENDELPPPDGRLTAD